MTFDLTRILESKRQHRRALAALPIEEKLRLLDDLRQRALDIRGSSFTGNLILREEPAVYGTRKP